ncbi:MAG: 3-ketoacyl-ACP reductase [Kiritimatiellaeota bacterium]|nr:3-ketoacyl-ACP reductase [Kiritimatiellota bacterium]
MASRVALVTGGGRGIGWGICCALADEGWDLALMGRRPAEDLRERLAALENRGVRTLYCRSDVSVATDRARTLERVAETFGRLNLLVNNAGVAPRVRADMLEAGEESFERVLRINLQGPYFLTQAAANWMVRQRRETSDFAGCIVNISSVSAVAASPNRGEYCISKAGLSMATRLWAVRLAEFDIPVYEVRPGITRTDMTAGVAEKYDRLIADGLCLQRRWGEPEDVGRAVAMLARGDLGYSTGQVLHVDGGLLVDRL